MDSSIRFQREISLPEKGSVLLFGPRMVGKTTTLRQKSYAKSYDLLDPNLEIKLRSHPGRLLDDIAKIPPGGRVFIDEVQKIRGPRRNAGSIA